jgi:hypothetical protein
VGASDVDGNHGSGVLKVRPRVVAVLMAVTMAVAMASCSDDTDGDQPSGRAVSFVEIDVPEDLLDKWIERMEARAPGDPVPVAGVVDHVDRDAGTLRLLAYYGPCSGKVTFDDVLVESGEGSTVFTVLFNNTAAPDAVCTAEGEFIAFEVDTREALGRGPIEVRQVHR